MFYKTALNELAETAVSFLKANEGMGNGYRSYVEGGVSIDGFHRPKWSTPIVDDLTGNEVRKRGEALWRVLCDVLKRNDLTECRFIAEHIEYGCYKFFVEIAERKRAD